MVGVARQAGHDAGIARLDRARGPAQGHHAAGAAHGDVVQPARLHAQVLGQAHGGVGRQGEAGDAQAVDIVLGQARAAQQFGQRPSKPIMGGVRAVTHIGQRDRHRHGHAVIGSPLHAWLSGRFFRARVSKQRGVPGRVGAQVFISPRWILLVVVSGRLSTKAT